MQHDVRGEVRDDGRLEAAREVEIAKANACQAIQNDGTQYHQRGDCRHKGCGCRQMAEAIKNTPNSGYRDYLVRVYNETELCGQGGVQA